MKKGFTLIELLVVMVVLAIIALITVPNALRMIDEAARRADIASVRNLVKAGEEYFLQEITGDGEFPFETNIYEFVNINGKRPDSAVIMVREDQNIYVAAVYNDRCYIKDYDSIEVIVSENGDDCEADGIGFAIYKSSYSWMGNFGMLVSKSGELFIKKNMQSFSTSAWQEIAIANVKDVYPYNAQNIYVLTKDGNLYQLNYDTLNATLLNTGVRDFNYLNVHSGTRFYLMNDGTVMSQGSSGGVTGAYTLVNLIGYESSNTSEPLTTIPGLTNVRKLVISETSAYAILENGTVMAWGANIGGAAADYTHTNTSLVTGTYNYANSPKLIPGLNNVRDIFTFSARDGFEGGPHSFIASTYAVLENGTVMVWGHNNLGQLGLPSSQVYYNTPVANATLNGIKDIQKVENTVLGRSQPLYYGLKTNGQLFYWDELNNIPTKVVQEGIKNLFVNRGHYNISTSMNPIPDNDYKKSLIGITLDSNNAMIISGMAFDFNSLESLFMTAMMDIQENGLGFPVEHEAYEPYGRCALTQQSNEEIVANCFGGLTGEEMMLVMTLTEEAFGRYFVDYQSIFAYGMLYYRVMNLNNINTIDYYEGTDSTPWYFVITSDGTFHAYGRSYGDNEVLFTALTKDQLLNW